MKIEKTIAQNIAYTSILKEQLRDLINDYRSKITYDIFCAFSMEKADEYDTNKEDKLNVGWTLSILLDRSKLFETSSILKFNISEIDIQPTDDQMQKLIDNTFEGLKDDFENIKKEFTFFEGLNPFQNNPRDYCFEELKRLFHELLKP